MAPAEQQSTGGCWHPVALAAEFSPEMAALLASASGRQQLSSLLRQRRDEALKAKLRKHLVAVGWSVVAKRNSVMAPRLRYLSPADGKPYDSLPHLVETATIQDHHQGGSPSNNKDQQQQDHCSNKDTTTMSSSSSSLDDEEEDDDVPVEEEEETIDGADAIAEYISVMAAQPQARGPRVHRLRASAKRHLEASGWTFWMKLKSNGREELRYKAPTGRSYISLHTACVAFVQNGCCSEQPGARPNKRKASQDDDKQHYCTTTTITKKKSRRLSELIIDCAGATDAALIKKCTTTRSVNKKTSELVVRGDGTRQKLLIKKCTTTTSTTSKKKKKSKHKKGDVTQARVLRAKGNTETKQQQQRRSSRTLVSVLIEKNILVPRDKVAYKETARDGAPVKKEGLISGDGGIKCTCCNKAFTVAEFEAHASGELGVDNQHPLWGGRVFLRDGRSLAQCLVQLMRDNTKIAASSETRMKVKSKCRDLDGDSVCSICHDGGDLLLCDNCPSTFHHDCLGLQGVPEGDWFCPCCRCGVCDGSDFDPKDATTRSFTDRTIIYCDQCEREYHVGCVRDRGCLPKGGGGQGEGEGPWLCSPGCAKVYQHLQGLVLGRPVPTSIEGVSLVVLRSSTGQPHGDQEDDEEIIKAAERHGKLCAALDVLHECFVTLIEPRTQTDLSDDIVFNRESELRRLDFRGYYVVGLEKAGELVTAATLRVYGNKVAELPLVGTRFAHRRQGMCHLLVSELERMLGGVLGVQRLVLPAVPELLQTWTGSFGFKAMTHSDKLQVAQHTILCFQGTTMCQKLLLQPKAE